MLPVNGGTPYVKHLSPTEVGLISLTRVPLAGFEPATHGLGNHCSILAEL